MVASPPSVCGLHDPYCTIVSKQFTLQSLVVLPSTLTNLCNWQLSGHFSPSGLVIPFPPLGHAPRSAGLSGGFQETGNGADKLRMLQTVILEIVTLAQTSVCQYQESYEMALLSLRTQLLSGIWFQSSIKNVSQSFLVSSRGSSYE